MKFQAFAIGSYRLFGGVCCLCSVYTVFLNHYQSPVAIYQFTQRDIL